MPIASDVFAAARAFFCLATKEAKMPALIARRPASSRWRNQKNSPAAQTAFDFCAIFKQQVPACAIKARPHEKRFCKTEREFPALDVQRKNDFQLS